MILSSLYISDTDGRGKGVFTNEIIPVDTVIEVSPVIVMTLDERVHLDKTLLHDYIFEWGEDKKQCCMGLGYLALYNHSYASNCEYFMDYVEREMMIKTVREINKGEELTTNYNGDWNDSTPIWFEDKE